ncbi:MAG TPA: UDP-N-acetylmuramoyl-L-alanyl-D-glutamate--2,6-diaminopimelate ligase [Candidatus Omnitrophota bacterium]|nr:UDP-N-acetylmuramoyl-L-alanyl-D-glutamate--2,6-diaminopimelate ligase [Candidatus Omnitrophota bacterium]HQO38682.1 UDP-N-acetylmuramoyl-L-alanyl-D-glutamate--2,6-diaminopimelate ligase [Candidatus Omnitrophota bacterium]HQQ06177.1 UDP-N-acetylmuramoyl-L-alanyl-D-glutamate--2,6-diaminopimelate ligase [Candidatus Omnitrophota bacterium]
MRLDELVSRLEILRIYAPGRKGSGIPCCAVTAISCNSREIQRDAVFVAVKGAQTDGHAFIQDALRRGARAIVFDNGRRVEPLVNGRTEGEGEAVLIQVADSRRALVALAEAFYGYPSKALSVTGITGTNGKTTISYLIEAIVRQAGGNPAVIGTVNYRYNDRVIESVNTTPGPVQLQRLFREMADGNVTHLAMEVSSHALDQDRVAGICFSSAIFTNLTQDHLDYHNGLEDYFRAKAKLFAGLESGAYAVINLDDQYGRRLVQSGRGKVVTYGLDAAAQISARDIVMDTDHTQFMLCGCDQPVVMKTPLIGRHNVYNVLAAAAWALQSGIPAAAIKNALERFTAVPGRLERIDGRGGVRIFVDYAHTPDALSNVINTLRPIAARKIIVVFGCGGDRDRTKRPVMGKVVAELSDHAVITSDNPRSEDPGEIIEDITRGISKTNYTVVPDRTAAIRTALSMGGEGDVVLIAGKGHETYQIMKDEVLHFDDREVVRECLRSLN